MFTTVESRNTIPVPRIAATSVIRFSRAVAMQRRYRRGRQKGSAAFDPPRKSVQRWARQSMNARASLAVTLCALALSALLASGCDSKPSYCSKVDQLELSVKDLDEIDLSKGVSSLTSAVSKVRTSANDAVAAAKKDFPTETGRIESSVSALATGIDQLPSSPSATQIATLTLEIKLVVDSVDSFVTQTKKKC